MRRAKAERQVEAPESGAFAEQLRMHREIARISRDFLSLDQTAIDEAMDEVIGRELAHAASLAGADRTQFIWVDPSHSESPWTCEWSADGVEKLGGRIGPKRFPWLTGELVAGRVIHVPTPASLPEQAVEERQSLAARGVRSLLAFPIHSAGELVGYHVYERNHEERAWTDQDITALRLLGEIFANAIKRRHTETALRESEERFRTITEEATELVAEFDAKGRYCYVSPSYEAHLGYRPEELLGQSAENLIHPDDNPSSRAKFVRSFREAVPSHSIHRLRRKDGEWRWYENSGRSYRGADGALRFVSIGIDINERIEAQEALERQLELERTVASLSRGLLGLREEELGEAIQKSLADAGRLTGADRAYLGAFADGPGDRGSFLEWFSERITKWTPDRSMWGREAIRRGELLHYPDIDQLPPEAANERINLRKRAVKSILAIPIRSGEVVVGAFGFDSCDRREWSEDEILLLRLIGEILISAQQRQKTELALRESQFQLAQSQKLEAVGRLAGGIAHDFNNLLTVILGLSRPILLDLEEGSQQRLDMEDIHGAAERAAALTRQLLTFSRRQPVEDRAIDLNATLSDLRPLLSRMLGEDVQLEYDLAEGDVWVRGDPHQFEQVVVNLAANARDAMPDGGTLCIGTETRKPEPERIARLRLPGIGPYVVISVSDTGRGMDEQTQLRIFDPFFTTKDAGKGTGLGLSIVHSVVEQAKGAIELESALGKGTRFLLWLPATAVEYSVLASPPDATLVRGHERVLFVEDEPAVRRLGIRILEQAGYSVLEASDGMEAIALLAEQTKPVDIVVSDVVMPNMGGGELATRLRGLRADLPILLISGHPEDRTGALDLDGLDLLQKPFTAEALLQRMRALLDHDAD